MFSGSITWFINIVEVILHDLALQTKLTFQSKTKDHRFWDDIPSFSVLVRNTAVRKWIMAILAGMMMYKKYLARVNGTRIVRK
jgi:hypothetical protein